MTKYKCIKNWYIMGRLAFTKGNEYEAKSYLEDSAIIRSDLWQPNIATSPILVSPQNLSEYFEEIKP